MLSMYTINDKNQYFNSLQEVRSTSYHPIWVLSVWRCMIIIVDDICVQSTTLATVYLFILWLIKCNPSYRSCVTHHTLRFSNAMDMYIKQYLIRVHNYFSLVKDVDVVCINRALYNIFDFIRWSIFNYKMSIINYIMLVVAKLNFSW